MFGFSHKKEAGGAEGAGDSERAEQRKILNEEKRNMIRGVEDLSETTAKEVMVPRIDVDFLSADMDPGALMEKIAQSGHSRFPVYSDSIDNVVGVLYVKDLIHLFASKADVDLKRIARKAYFVPESKRIDSLLREFKRKHLHIAIVIDEYGGVSGIVTMEDIIEEIVGDIQDEFDNEREDILPMGGSVYLCDARVDLDDLNETIGSSFPADDFDTLGGFVFDLFGKVPAQYEKAKWNNFTFIVHEMDGHRINMIKIIRNDNEERKDEDASDSQK